MKEVPPSEVTGNADWKPLLSFTDQSPSFAHGAEFGMIYQQLATKTFEPRAVRFENIEVLKAAAAHFGSVAVFAHSEVEGWWFMELEPFKLKVV